LKDNKTPWGLADRWCWGKKRVRIQPQLHHLIDRLNELREPIPVFEKQLIHGDLNPENILIAPDTDPAILDFSPFWGPPDFVLAIFANFIGPRQGNLEALKHFRHIQFFDQLLVRAAIRMLLGMAVIDHLEDW
jgi:aminoglycoside phosphotransferase (APT) family kinase protein